MRKNIIIDESHLSMLKKIQDENKLRNISETVRFVIEQYDYNHSQKEHDDELIEKLLDAYNKKYYALFERFRWASQMSEKNSTIILDAVNTLLLMQDVNEVVLADSLQAPVVKESMDVYKEKIAHFKQKKDERKRKNEMK